MICFSSPQQKAQLVQLYQSCFPGDEAFCTWYFDTLWNPASTLVYAESSTVGAMLHMLPLPLSQQGAAANGVYLFALGTAPALRGKGIMGAMIRRALDTAKAQGTHYAALLVQHPELLGFYAAQGFSQGCFVSRNTAAAAPIPQSLVLRPMLEQDYAAVQHIYTVNVHHTLHGIRTPAFFSTLLQVYQSTCYVLANTNGEVLAYAAGAAKADNTLQATECMGTHAKALMAALAWEHALPTAAWNGAPTGENAVPLGCFYALTSQPLPPHTFLNLLYN